MRSAAALRTGEPIYELAAKFWTKLFAVNFALGVATGIVMEFQFGTNWATYSRFGGDVFGSALAAEGLFAFFLESGFLAVLVFGWGRVSKGLHFLASVMVALGSAFSAVWIVVANSWQQTPAGYHLVGTGPEARAEITDFWAMIFNPSSVVRTIQERGRRRSSALTIACLTALFGIAQYPNLLTSSLRPRALADDPQRVVVAEDPRAHGVHRGDRDAVRRGVHRPRLPGLPGEDEDRRARVLSGLSVPEAARIVRVYADAEARMSDQPNVKGSARRATYQDVLDAPEEKVAELIDGELVLSPRPSKRHTVFASELGGDLIGPFRRGRGGPGGWVILVEPELHFGRQILVPDLAGWRRERAEPNDERAFYTTAPDWICEVLSPSTAARDRTRKLPIYAHEKVAHVWLADPTLRTLEVLALENGRWVLLAAYLGDEKVHAPPFDAVELDLAPLWAT